MIMMKRIKKRYIPFLVIPFFLVSCQSLTVDTIYGALKFYLVHQIDNYFDLTGKQRSDIEKKLEGHIAWHRKEGAKEIIAILKMLKKDIQNGTFHEKDLARYEPLFRKHQKVMGEKVFNDMVDFCMNLSHGQITHLQKELTKGEDKFYERMQLPRKERIRQKSKFSLQVLEFFLGYITEKQKEEFYRLAMKGPDLSQESFRMIQKRNKYLVYLLRSERYDRDNFRDKLSRWFATFESEIPAGYRKKMQLAKSRTLKNIVYFNNHLITKKQRDHAIKRLDSLIVTLEKGIK
jgi:hypothetical protein